MKIVVTLLLILVIFTSISLGYGLVQYTKSANVIIQDETDAQPSGFNLFPDPTPTPTPSPPPFPEKYVIPQRLHVFQTFNNCGPASLSMQLSYFDRTVSQQVLGESLRPYQHPTGDNDDKSVTLAELAEEAKKYKLNAIHRTNGSIEILNRLIALDLPVVIRTWLKEGEDIGHYRLIRGYDTSTQTLIQDDSLQGKDLEYSFDEMTSLWQPFNYEYLVLYPDEKAETVALILGEEMNEEKAWLNARNRIIEELAADPSDIYAQFNMSVTQYHLKEYQSSVAYFEAVKPHLPSRMLWYQIEPLLAYYELGEYQKLTILADSILENHNRAFAELYYLKGKALLDQGNGPGAREEFKKALVYKHNYLIAQEELSTLNLQ